MMERNAFVPAVMEHIELAGVHSGDSACVIPSVHITRENVETIKEYTKKDRRRNACTGTDEYAVRHREWQGICAGGEPESIPYRTACVKGL